LVTELACAFLNRWHKTLTAIYETNTLTTQQHQGNNIMSFIIITTFVIAALAFSFSQELKNSEI